MRPDQLPLLQTLSSPSLSPDGHTAIVAVSHPSFEADATIGQLWAVPTNGQGSPRRFTRGFHDSAPRFSPDGRLIAFLRQSPGSAGQLAIVEAEGGEPLVITDQRLGVSDFAFSPDSRTILFTARTPDEGRHDPEVIDAAHEDPRSFTGYWTQHNGVGWYRDRPLQLFSLPVPDLGAEPPVKAVGRMAEQQSGVVPEPNRFTHDHHDWQHAQFLDAQTVVAVRDRDEDTLASQVWSFPDAKTDPELLWPTDGSDAPKNINIAGLEVSVIDGRPTVWVAGTDMGLKGVDGVGHHDELWRITSDGLAATKVTDLGTTLHDFCVDGATAWISDDHRGSGRLLRLEGDHRQVLTDGALTVRAVAANGGEVVATVTSPTSHGDLARWDGDQLQLLTDFSAGLRDQANLVEPIEVEATAPDGYPVHGWALVPEGEGPHPTLLVIHGGPYMYYGPSVFDEAQVYVAAGYAVLMCNPRGARGYGTEHGRAVKGAMGQLDMTDVLAFLDHYVQEFNLDDQRLGVMGGSYGGYLTAWITAHDHRFRGAIVERAYLDPWAHQGAADIGWFFSPEYTSYDRAEADAMSPMFLTDQVRTPTLVIHSEQDLRCPISQALEYYTLLRRAGVETELLVFPGENHELTRSGTPWHRRARFEKILQFWDDHLS